MAIKYRDDPDLSFLRSCENDDLAVLVQYLTKDKDGKTRFAEELLNDPLFKECNGQYNKVWQQIAGELQLFGGDTISNKIRKGQGIFYREILYDVCNEKNVKYSKSYDVVRVESLLIEKFIQDAWTKMSDDERRKLFTALGLDETLVAGIGVAAIIAMMEGSSLFTYQATALIANQIARYLAGKGLIAVAGGPLLRGITAFAGPAAIAIATLMTISTITGTAYRVTIPCVIQVAWMRQKLLNKDRF